MLMILWSQPRLAVAGTPGVDSSLVESIDSSLVCHESVSEYLTWTSSKKDIHKRYLGGGNRTRSGKGKMEPRWNVNFLLNNPEIRKLAAQSDGTRESHYFLVT